MAADFNGCFSSSLKLPMEVVMQRKDLDVLAVFCSHPRIRLSIEQKAVLVQSSLDEFRKCVGKEGKAGCMRGPPFACVIALLTPRAPELRPHLVARS